MMLSLDTAYRSFAGEVEASSNPTICRLPDSRRHQLSAIAHRLTFHPSSDNDYHTGLAGYQVVLVGSGPAAQAVRRQNLVRYLRARFAWREQRHAAGVSETPCRRWRMHTG